MNLSSSTPLRRTAWTGLSVATLCLGLLSADPAQARPATPAQAQPASPADAPAATQPAPPESPGIPGPARTNLPIMKLDDVRIGMKGYGLSVFHGTKIETFPVEVISVQRDFAPRRGVIWVKCTDERMQKSGPVHGMSGSPIFLWPKGEEQKDGQGGQLIGAFAFGYQMVTECYVGIQPIEQMLDAAGRVNDGQPAQDARQAAIASQADAAGAWGMIQSLITTAKSRGGSPMQTWQADTLAKALEPHAMRHHLVTYRASEITFEPDFMAKNPGREFQLTVPLNVGSPLIADLTRNLLAPLGIEPMATAGGIIGSRPPVEVDADSVKLEPGSVLAVPLAWGDADLSSSGTVTALTAEGDVMAFGHAMFGEGAIALPMATGYVHMVMPTLVSSFKLGGSLQIKGTLLRDEQSAVVGANRQVFKSSPVHVHVTMPGHPQRDYQYQVAHHRSLTPILAAICTLQSVTAVQNPPALNSVRIKATLRFSDKEQVHIDTLQPMADPVAVAMQILPPLSVMANNPFESRMLESMDVQAIYEPQVLLSSIARGNIARPVVAQGDDVDIHLWLQPYGGQAYHRKLTIKVPDTLPDGDYQLIVGNGQAYMGMILGTRQHLSNPTDIDSLFALVKQVMEMDSTSIYVMLQSPEEGLAVGRQEMPALPSSRKTILTGSASSQTSPYQEWIVNRFKTDHAIEGLLSFNLQVRQSRDLSQPTP